MNNKRMIEKIKELIDGLIMNEVDLDNEIPIEIVNDLATLHSSIEKNLNNKELYNNLITSPPLADNKIIVNGRSIFFEEEH